MQRLVGPNNILRFVDVIPVDNFERGGDAGARRFRIFGTVPFVPGEYELEIKVRWFNGLAEIHHEGESPRPIFLGSEEEEVLRQELDEWANVVCLSTEGWAYGMEQSGAGLCAHWQSNKAFCDGWRRQVGP